jgi:hypothetical protein
MEITDMTDTLSNIEQFFFEARRSAFLISLLCFIGTGISLTALTALDPALGVIIPILALIVITLFTLFFLLLAFRLFQPIREIVKMVDKLYTDVMRDEMDVELAGAETEKQQLEKLTQQVEELKEEIIALKKQVPSAEEKQVPSVEKRDWFWPILILKWAVAIIFVLLLTFMVPDVFNVYFAVAGVVGLTIIALVYARNKGRLKWPRRPKWLGGDEK